MKDVKTRELANESPSRSTEVKTETKSRRIFDANFKLRVLKEADLCRGDKLATGELLRREGIYSSLLAEWRKQRDSGALSAFSLKRGRKLKRTAAEIETESLRREVSRLSDRLRQANLIIEAQKKIAALLGNSIESSETE